METFTYYLSIEIEAMNEDSAENKLEGFLKGLDLKKNQHLTLTSLEIGDGEEATEAPEDAEEEPKKKSKSRPPIALPKGKGSAKWDDEFDDAEWDELDEEPKPKKVKAETLAAEDDDDEDWWADDEDDEDDDGDDGDDDDDESDDEDDDIASIMKGY